MARFLRSKWLEWFQNLGFSSFFSLCIYNIFNSIEIFALQNNYTGSVTLYLAWFYPTHWVSGYSLGLVLPYTMSVRVFSPHLAFYPTYFHFYSNLPFLLNLIPIYYPLVYYIVYYLGYDICLLYWLCLFSLCLMTFGICLEITLPLSGRVFFAHLSLPGLTGELILGDGWRSPISGIFLHPRYRCRVSHLPMLTLRVVAICIYERMFVYVYCMLIHVCMYMYIYRYICIYKYIALLRWGIPTL